MVQREVNPLEERHLALSTRFKSAWALHQLLLGMQRMSSGTGADPLTATFQSLYARLKSFAESLNGRSTGHDTLAPTLTLLERETDELCETLLEREEKVSPSDLRRFLSQVKTLDDRILIEVARFYLEMHRRRRWQQDRLVKIDLLLSRLAERIAGRELKGDRVRLEKVLHGLLQSAGPVQVDEQEVDGLSETLNDLRSEVRWLKTIDELNESSLLEVYRALKRDMAERMFHPRLLPAVLEVNNAFSRKIDELRQGEEARLLDEYQNLSRMHRNVMPADSNIEVQLTGLQQQFDEFRERVRDGNVRLGEILRLGQSVKELAVRIELQQGEHPGSSPLPGAQASSDERQRLKVTPRVALVPDIESLQPHWSQLLQSLAVLGLDFTIHEVEQDSSLAAYRLESRELEAFRRTIGSEPANIALEQFLLAAATLRHRLCQDVVELKGLQGRGAGEVPRATWLEARESSRLADAYVKHYTHLIDQALLDGEADEARSYLLLKNRLMRELSGLLLLLSSLEADTRADVSLQALGSLV